MRPFIGPATAIGILFATPHARAEQFPDAAYSCVSEFSGGLAWDEQKKNWTGGAFKPGRKFVLQVKFLGRVKKDLFGVERQVDGYDVAVTSGTNEPRQCVEPSEAADSNAVEVDDRGFFSCVTVFNEYRFNLKTRRFLH